MLITKLYRKCSSPSGLTNQNMHSCISRYHQDYRYVLEALDWIAIPVHAK